MKQSFIDGLKIHYMEQKQKEQVAIAHDAKTTLSNFIKIWDTKTKEILHIKNNDQKGMFLV